MDSFDIDLVYLWVDGDDPAWLARKRALTGDFREGSDTDSRARYVSNDELRYSLRSAAMFAPWIRRIFVVTDGQTPRWLDTSDPRVRIVDHSEIVPRQALPCFNSRVLEYFIYRIPGLAEHFLYANDDMFFGAPVDPGFFFAPDGCPIVRLLRYAGGKWRYGLKNLLGLHSGNYRRAVLEAALLAGRKFGKFYAGIPHHNVDAYRLSDYRSAVEDFFAPQVAGALGSRTKSAGDLQRLAFSLSALATGRAHLRYVGRRESCRIRVQKPDYMKFIRRYHPALFCLNDTQHATDGDRSRIAPFLETLFPEPSGFEK